MEIVAFRQRLLFSAELQTVNYTVAAAGGADDNQAFLDFDGRFKEMQEIGGIHSPTPAAS